MIDVPSRRRVLQLGAAVAATWLAPRGRALARPSEPTPPAIEGPFYPPDLARAPSLFALDDDSDLVWRAGAPGFARGTILELAGTIADVSGQPVPNVEVHVWQCDAAGRYRHPGDTNPAPVDDAFQGFGRTVTDGDGRYGFRTIAPVPYPGRTPHIHFRLEDASGANLLTTQMYVVGEPGNASDAIYQAVPVEQRDRVTVRLSRPRHVKLGGVSRERVRGTFTIVLGVTPRIA